jgi:hypothetical protein
VRDVIWMGGGDGGKGVCLCVSVFKCMKRHWHRESGIQHLNKSLEKV